MNDLRTKPPHRILIVGGNSMIASEVARLLEGPDTQILRTTRSPAPANEGWINLDLNSKDIDLAQMPENIDTVIFAAAMTSEVDCSANPTLSKRINVDNTIELLAHYNSQNSHLIFLSTTLVLNGDVPAATEDTAYSPLGIYGSQKAQAEQWLLNNGTNFAICRLGKVLDRSTPLLEHWQTQLKNDAPISAFEDYYLSPITLNLATRTLWRIATKKSNGIYQITARDTVSYLELATQLAKALGVTAPVLQASSWRDNKNIAFSPQYTHLDGTRVQREFGLKLPSSQETIQELFGNLI